MATDSAQRPAETPNGLAKSSTKSQNSERVAILLEIISKAHVALGRELPEQSEREQMLRIWAELLEHIPTNRLNPCYVAAMRDHEGMGMLAPHELVQAFRKPVPRVDKNPLTGPRMTPEELVAEVRKLREQIPAESSRGFRPAASVPLEFEELADEPIDFEARKQELQRKAAEAARLDDPDECPF